MTSEQEFYSDPEVVVTSARFRTKGQTIAMSGITAVSTFRILPGKLELITLLVGLALLYWGGTDPDLRRVIWWGLPLVAFAIWSILNPVYTLNLTSASGKQRVLSTRKKQRIFAIAHAINEVIVHRA